jgi:hypothetical protein
MWPGGKDAPRVTGDAGASLWLMAFTTSFTKFKGHDASCSASAISSLLGFCSEEAILLCL